MSHFIPGDIQRRHIDPPLTGRTGPKPAEVTRLNFSSLYTSPFNGFGWAWAKRVGQ